MNEKLRQMAVKNGMNDKFKEQRKIVVDLDGTLIQTDMLIENLFAFLRLYPLRVFLLFIWLLRGKAYFKKCLATAVVPDVGFLPYNKDLLSWLELQKQNGAILILATASNIEIAQRIASHLKIFDEILGTEDVNLASSYKSELLNSKYGISGYEYVGNSMADIAVWKTASNIHVVNPERGVLLAVKKLGEVDQLFESRPAYFPSLLKTMRIHQWVKNILLFVPLLASHRILDIHLIINGVIAFIAFGLCASSVYLLNDLFDLPEDRQHPTKSNRPLTAGMFPIIHALGYMAGLFIVAFLIAFLLLPLQFFFVLFGYYALTLTYSLYLKRIVMLDVVALAMLYTIRVIAGAAAMGLIVTFWILAFCVFIFLSLAFVKRYTELNDARIKGKLTQVSGRGYMPDDFELLASLGGSSGYISALVLALYINDTSALNLYQSPKWMWVACPLLLFWLSRVWLLAHRGQMHDDPIVFALRDGVSRWIGLGFVAVFVLATF